LQQRCAEILDLELRTDGKAQSRRATDTGKKCSNKRRTRGRCANVIAHPASEYIESLQKHALLRPQLDLAVIIRCKMLLLMFQQDFIEILDHTSNLGMAEEKETNGLECI